MEIAVLISNYGTYGFNTAQPSDYTKWRNYCKALAQYLVDNYGSNTVKTWGFMFGIEGDWQFDAVPPLTTQDNCHEFLKTFDYFQAGVSDVLGQETYLSIRYFLTETFPILDKLLILTVIVSEGELFIVSVIVGNQYFICV
jgi:hypothetical protein